MILPSNFWSLPIDEARKVKWQVGREAHAEVDPLSDFVGDPVQELYLEMLDAINYAEEIERTKRVDLWVDRQAFYKTAAKLQYMMVRG